MRKEEDLSDEEDLDDRLPDAPTDSPREERDRYTNNRISHKGAVATPLAQVMNAHVMNSRRQPDSEDEEEEERTDKAPDHKEEQEQRKPEVAPKPGKEKPPVAKVRHSGKSSL